MNILIKNADYSEVKVETIDVIRELQKSAICGNCSIGASGNVVYTILNNVVCYDISNLQEGTPLRIVGYRASAESNSRVASFCSGTCPTENISIESADDPNLNSLVTEIGSTISIVRSDISGLNTIDTVIPPNATVLLVYASNKNTVNVHLYEKLIQ